MEENASSAPMVSTTVETEELTKEEKDEESVEIEKASKSGEARKGAESGEQNMVEAGAAFGDVEKSSEYTESDISKSIESDMKSDAQSTSRATEKDSEYSQSQKSGTSAIAGSTGEDVSRKPCGYQCSPVTSQDIVEGVVCHESELKENEMKTFDLGGLGDIMVVRQKGQIYAICNECSHYGAPLHTGALGIGRVRCPWHGACFNLATGDIEDFPGLDSLPTLKVSVQQDGGVKIETLRKGFENKKRVRCKATVRRLPTSDTRTFVVAGGGPAGQVCAETLRECGFQGKIIMLAKEPYLPYERIVLSKALVSSIEGINLRSKHFYKKYDIDLKLGIALVSLNTKEKVIDVSSGEKIHYDSIFLATGSRARALTVPGSNLSKMFVLRGLDDTKQIEKEIKANINLVIIGASFIAMECAAHCVTKGAKVTVVSIETVPFEAALGTQIGERILKWFEEEGVSFVMNATVEAVLPSETNPSCVGQIKLSDGRMLAADVVVAGIGVIPETDYLQGSSIITERNGTVSVNEFLETNIPDVFAGGDIAHAPVLGRYANIGHWQLAHYHGRIAGCNMSGRKQCLRTVPFFWTSLFDRGIKYAGYGVGYDDIVLHGNLDELEFIAYYCIDDSVAAIAACGGDPIVSQFAELLHLGKKITKAEVQESPSAWTGNFLISESYSTMGSESSKHKGSKKGGDKDDDVIEGIVCQESDLIENEMKAFEVGDHGKILVVRQKGQIYAVGNKCTHYGAPLHTGALGDGHVRCPWHGACFNLATGDIEDFPGLDSLPCFKVEVQKDGGVKVRGSLNMLKAGRRQKCMVAFDKKDNKTFIVVGGGPAAQVCAETLRQDGFKGHLIMLTKEQFLPYDRIKLSKLLDFSAEKLALRTADFYKDNNIDLKLGTELLNLDATNKVASLSSGEKLNYDSIFLATGSRARPLSVAGSDLKKIFVLRNVDDANEIANEVKEDKNVVVVGASFIGMECAAYCVGKAKSVTVVGRGPAPFAPVLGPQIGGQIMKWFEEKGIKFCMDTDVVEILSSEADSSCVGAVKLATEQILPADIVVAGIGAVANTDYLKDSSVELGKGGTIPVNEFLETNVPGVFAGGDIAFAPVLGRVASIGHWQLAHYHGRIAGRNMLGKKEPLNTVPFFWTMLFNKGIRYAGYAPDFDDVVLHGNLEELKFIAYYCKGNSVLAVATCGSDPVAAQFAELLSSGKSITKNDIQENPTAWIK